MLNTEFDALHILFHNILLLLMSACSFFIGLLIDYIWKLIIYTDHYLIKQNKTSHYQKKHFLWHMLHLERKSVV